MHRPIRVGYILKVFPRLSETFILNEILELERQGAGVEIFSLHPPQDTRFHGELANLKASIHYVPRADSSEIWRKLRNLYATGEHDRTVLGDLLLKVLRQDDEAGQKTLWQSLWIAAEARLRGIDHFHAHFASSATRTAMIASRAAARSFSFTAHAKDIFADARERDLLPEALAACAFAVTVTDFNIGHFQCEYPAVASKVRRIYNGLPLAEMTPTPRSNLDVLLAVGRLVEKKGFDVLIEACRILHQKGKRFRCRIVGDGPQRAALERQIADAGVPSMVELAGALPRQAVLEEIRNCAQFVLPCIVAADGNRDALPTVLLEALALARPCVTTDLEGVTEIVDHEETGLLVPQNDAAALADGIERMLDDRALAERTRLAGREKAERLFDIATNVSELRRLFEQHGGPRESIEAQELAEVAR